MIRLLIEVRNHALCSLINCTWIVLEDAARLTMNDLIHCEEHHRIKGVRVNGQVRPVCEKVEAILNHWWDMRFDYMKAHELLGMRWFFPAVPGAEWVGEGDPGHVMVQVIEVAIARAAGRASGGGMAADHRSAGGVTQEGPAGWSGDA